MPVYHAKRKPTIVRSLPFGELQKPSNRDLYHLGMVVRHGKERYILKSEGWPSMDSPLRHIKRLGIPLNELIRSLAEDHTRSRPFTVLDWGCGTGRAAATLGRLFKQSGNVKVYGYGNESFTQWDKYRKNATFIHSPREDLKRYFSRRKIDLTYSRLGIGHLSEEGLQEHMKTIHAIIAPRGVLVIELNPYNESSQLKTILNSGFTLVTQNGVFRIFQKE